MTDQEIKNYRNIIGKKLSKIINLAYVINASTNHDVSVDYSGHVKKWQLRTTKTAMLTEYQAAILLLGLQVEVGT